ncbi:hypothetical protein GCM10027072_64750 [Streptomyces bullii]
MLCRLLIQRASNELARTPFCTGGTAVSLSFGGGTPRAARRAPLPVGQGRVRRPGAPRLNFAQFLVQLHASVVSVDNSRGVNPGVGATS